MTRNYAVIEPVSREGGAGATVLTTITAPQHYHVTSEASSSLDSKFGNR